MGRTVSPGIGTFFGDWTAGGDSIIQRAEDYLPFYIQFNNHNQKHHAHI